MPACGQGEVRQVGLEVFVRKMASSGDFALAQKTTNDMLLYSRLEPS